jgi:hypothetical protein
MKTQSRPPNGQQERVRYKVAYEAFWWNCVSVRAVDLNRRCPFLPSGTPAACAGAWDGETNADEQIEALLKTYPARRVQTYLRSLASSPRAKGKMQPYFESPQTEIVNQ